ncbi:hypothetical protein [Corynebacterium kalidii]|uniref:Uncharacterized protein n=1 Tax=Corynebacterium kalidii TaxID=2931982 RepID=A0A9X1WGH5_9CORY|nr:hypothetical protein [Corynebacterium kalidii]MCJ7858018.1 hypothetical protein [Corynebacterium kalidii]
MDYELEPERPADSPPTADDRSTEHHESLLRAEAARASRANRVLGSLVVAGFAAATVLGIVTWQNASSNQDGPASVEEAVADGSLATSAEASGGASRDERTSVTPSADSDARGTGRVDPARPDRSPDDHVTPLTADQYAPPNAWSGDRFVTPSPYPADSADGADNADGDTGTDGTGGTDATPGNGSGDSDLPSISDLLPSIPGIPTVPGGDDSPTTGPTDGTTEPTESTEDTEDSGNSDGDSGTAEATEPSEPGGPADPSNENTPGTLPGSGSTSTGSPDSTGDDRDAVTDTTGPAPR